MKLPTIERLHELFCLDAETGVLTRKVDVMGHRSLVGRVGDVVGWKRDGGYRETSVDYSRVRVHRIVFAMTHGRWPQRSLDHINGDPTDNRPENLREATHNQQMWNTGVRSRTASGLKGAYFDKNKGKWYSRIMAHRKDKHLGFYPDAESAHRAYLAAAKELHGEFART